MDIEIDLSADGISEVEILDCGLSDNLIKIAGLSIVVNSDQFDSLLAAVKEWSED